MQNTSGSFPRAPHPIYKPENVFPVPRNYKSRRKKLTFLKSEKTIKIDEVMMVKFSQEGRNTCDFHLSGDVSLPYGLEPLNFCLSLEQAALLIH